MTEANDSSTPSERPASHAAGPGGGLPPREIPKFQVVRSAQPADEGGSVAPLVVAVALALAGGSYFLFFRGDEPGAAADEQPAVTAPQDEVDVPQGILDHIHYLEDEGYIGRALDYAEEHYASFPNRVLKEKIDSYRRELGLDDSALPSAAELVRDARRMLDEGELGEAIELAELALEQDPRSAQAYFVRGLAFGLLDDKLAAQNDLHSAIDNGYQPRAEAEALLKRFQQ